VWLWKVGARRAAWDELSAWRAVTQPPRDVALDDAYLVAARWWTPLDLPGPSAEQLRGPMRCAFVACPPREVVGDAVAERAYLLAPLAPPVRDPADAAAVAIITLRQALRGEVSWGAAIAARVDLAAFAVAAQRTALPAFARPVITRLAGRDARPVVPSTGAQVVDATEDQRLVIAATRALDGAAPDEVTAALDGLSTQAATALRMLIEPLAVLTGDARAEAAMRYSKRLVPAAVNVDALRAIAAAFARDPAISDRLARDAVAVATDAAVMHAGIGAVFDALGDPARARAAWQAAVDASPEPAFLRGLACAQARQGDGPAALVLATSAAAASGDPAVVWTAVARALVGAGRHVAALEAARSAIDLAGPETLAPALDAAIAASRALDRDAQADRLTAQRARIAPINGRLGDRDPTDARAALDAHRAGATPATLAALWTASRWNPRDVELRAALLAALTDAPRRASITTELVELAGDRDPEVGRAAVAALR
jgi:tetratricopeptide (TPR) repeat protein